MRKVSSALAFLKIIDLCEVISLYCRHFTESVVSSTHKKNKQKCQISLENSWILCIIMDRSYSSFVS